MIKYKCFTVTCLLVTNWTASKTVGMVLAAVMFEVKMCYLSHLASSPYTNLLNEIQYWLVNVDAWLAIDVFHTSSRRSSSVYHTASLTVVWAIRSRCVLDERWLHSHLCSVLVTKMHVNARCERGLTGASFTQLHFSFKTHLCCYVYACRPR